MSPIAYTTLGRTSIDIKSEKGKMLKLKTIEAGKNNLPAEEFYFGWQKDYNKGQKSRK